MIKLTEEQKQLKEINDIYNFIQDIFISVFCEGVKKQLEVKGEVKEVINLYKD